MAEQELFVLEELERQINALPTYVLGKSTESVIRPLRVFLEDLKKRLRRQGGCDKGLRECLLEIFPGQEVLVGYFIDEGYAFSLTQLSLDIYLQRALDGDSRARGVLYALMLSYLQGGGTEFEEATGMLFYGLEGGHPQNGGNCANFASWFLYFGMGLSPEDWGTPGLDEAGQIDWGLGYLTWGTQQYQGTDTWRSANMLFDHLVQRSNSQDIGFDWGLPVKYGDLAFYGSDNLQHVAVVVGYGPNDRNAPFYPTFEEAVKRLVRLNFPEIDVNTTALEQLTSLLVENKIEVLPWIVDHSGMYEFPRPISEAYRGSYGDPSHLVHIKYPGEN